MVASRVRVSADLARHVAWLEGDFALGFHAVYLHYLGRHLEQFIDVFAARVLPGLTHAAARETAPRG